jgi:hypothetical protein
MARPLSFLSAEALDAALSLALRCAARRGGRYVEAYRGGPECWEGPAQPGCVFELLEEYRERYKARPRRRGWSVAPRDRRIVRQALRRINAAWADFPNPE